MSPQRRNQLVRLQVVSKMNSDADVMTALIGTCFEMFAIRRDAAGEYRYLVRGIEVTRHVFLDAFELARADRFDPADPQFRALLAKHGLRLAEEPHGDDDERNVH